MIPLVSTLANTTKVALVFALTSALLVAACASSPAGGPTAGDMSLTQSEQGLALVSIGYALGDNRYWNGQTSNARLSITIVDASASPGREKTLPATFDPGATRRTEHGMRTLMALRLQPGSYRIARYRAEIPGGILDYTADPQGPAHFVFQVRRGQITYIGAHELHTQMGKSFISRDVPATARFVLRDELADDRRLLYYLHPELKSVAIVNAVTGTP